MSGKLSVTFVRFCFCKGCEQRPAVERRIRAAADAFAWDLRVPRRNPIRTPAKLLKEHGTPMKKPVIIATLILTSLLAFGPRRAQAQDIDTVAPVVIKTFPEAGAKDVAAGVVEVKVTFSKPMADQSWSWSTAWQNSCPESIGKPRYDADGKTCILKVKLEAGKTYGWWINSARFHGFQDSGGRAAVPYLLVFKVKD
jgi:hypothetical protein